ncbi:syntaxin-121-like [Curcuma longa]|uniref:syntaxin-121-like n=1 Tax=Curcuma longa TaxID=136217 RepID=UPI003D9EA871
MDGSNLDQILQDADAIEEELREVERLHRRLRESNEAGKALHDASAVRALRLRMDADSTIALKKAGLIKLRLQSLDRADAAGGSADRSRATVVAGLRRKLRASVAAFAELRRAVSAEYRETLARRYFTLTGEAADEATVEALVAAGEGERLLQQAIEEGRGQGLGTDVVAEIQERRGAAEELERNLVELQRLFVDMAVSVEAQGLQMDDIEANVGRANSFVRHGAEELAAARHKWRSSRNWACVAAVVLTIVILIAILAVVLTLAVNNRKVSSFSLFSLYAALL